MNNMKKKIIMKNLPGLSAIPDGKSLADFYPRVRFNLFESSGNLPRTFKRLIITTLDDYEIRGELALLNDPTIIPGYIHYRLKTWSQFNSNLLEQERFGKYLHRSVAGNRIIDSIAGGSHNEAKRIKAVYQFVRNTYRWNGEFSMFARQDFKDFIHNRMGSSAEINLILTDLLRQAGIKADPLLVRTRDLGVPEKMYPVKNQFNHVIVLAEIKGIRILLDATSGSNDLQKLNQIDIGTEGWIVREDDPGWIEIFSLENRKGQGEGEFNL